MRVCWHYVSDSRISTIPPLPCLTHVNLYIQYILFTTLCIDLVKISANDSSHKKVDREADNISLTGHHVGETEKRNFQVDRESRFVCSIAVTHVTLKKELRDSC